MPHDYALAATALVVAWMLCAAAHPAVRRALIGGLRCVGRYPDLWRIPALFGLGYAAFQCAATVLFHGRVDDLGPWLATWEWKPQPELHPLLLAALFPAAERTASVFTIFTATFPLSALFALLLIFNFRGLLVEMTKALRRRLGRGFGLVATGLLLVTALAAVLKPAVYLLLPEITARAPFVAALSVNLLSAIFELLLGIFFLTYLMFLSYAWMRGLYFHRFKLFHVAMRRTGFVLKWSLPLATLATLLVMLPLYFGILFAPGEDTYAACAWFSQWIGRPLVTALALVYCPVQAILVFHNESLRQALRDSGGLLRAKWPVILLFLVASYSPFFLLDVVSSYSLARLGEESIAALAISLAAACAEALLAGWLIASWICLYKNFSTGRKEILF